MENNMPNSADNLTPPPITNPSVGQILLGLTSQQKMALIVAAAASMALLIGLWMWGQAPEYRVLFSNLSDRDGGAIIESLQQQNIPYKFAEGGGALLVPADKVHEVRLRLASQGLPKGGTAGFELMEAQKFGTSQFLEQVNYQHALEGELSRSIETLGSVQSARVHLAIPKPTVFVKDKEKPGASVVLTLHPGRTLEPGQVNGIVHLISSSIPNMPAQNVTVLDQDGNMLSTIRDGNDLLMNATQLKFVREVEHDYIKRIEAILIPITGQQNVKAQVTANIDFAQVEQTAESFKPNQRPNTAAVRSSQTLEMQNGSNGAGGVPGALTNQPPLPATAPLVSGPNGQPITPDGGTTNSRKEATANYEVDRTIQHTKMPVGNITRLSVAVVINNRNVTDKSGKVTSRPYTDAENAQITALIKDAMGFDPKRGDSLNLLNRAFNNEKEIIPELPWWKDPQMIALAKEGAKYLLIFLAAMFLIFGVIRPAVKSLAPPPPPPPPEEDEDNATSEDGLADGEDSDGEEGEPELSEAAQRMNVFDANLQLAKDLTKNDPKIVAMVIKDWVNNDE
jgi:flagellar M-ring protein FliF